MKRIAFTAPQTAELLERPGFEGPIESGDIRGRTLVSLISPGTELNWGFLGSTFPFYPGYASVFQVEEVGDSVEAIQPGDVVFASGGHGERQQMRASAVVRVPPDLKPEVAVFARLMGVSMTTLNVTEVRAPERVLVTGLGPIGNLAAQIFASCGYEVTAIDPVEARRQAALAVGIRDVRSSFADIPEFVDKIGLHLECSGHEQAVVDGCKSVRKRGEVVLVGVPWTKRTDVPAFDVLHAVFHRYIILRSGWEWEIPKEPVDFSGNSILGNFTAAIRWLSEGRIKVDSLATGFAPGEAPKVYAGLLAQSLPTLGAYFDWRK